MKGNSIINNTGKSSIERNVYLHAKERAQYFKEKCNYSANDEWLQSGTVPYECFGVWYTTFAASSIALSILGDNYLLDSNNFLVGLGIGTASTLLYCGARYLLNAHLVSNAYWEHKRKQQNKIIDSYEKSANASTTGDNQQEMTK